MIKADILLDSINTSGNRLTTWVLKYPRFCHSEVMTHRVFSRNASSSRAIPVKKMLDDVINDPAMPIYWGKNQAGMAAKEELDNVIKRHDKTTYIDENKTTALLEKSYLTDLEQSKHLWLDARDKAVETVKKLADIGLHKQAANRILEPWMHITVILTASEYGNFFSLRAHEAAQPEFQSLAYMMLEKYNNSVPTVIPTGEWHIPFGDKMPEGITHEQKLKIATARCARTSYLTFDGEIKPEKDYELHDQLAVSGHWSPFEHVARAQWNSSQSGNFKGWEQYRKTFLNENRTDERVLSK